MNRTSLIVAILFGLIFAASPARARAAQAAVEAGAISASVSGVATASSRALNRSPLTAKPLSQSTSTVVVHTTRPARSTRKTENRGKRPITTAASRAPHQQGHIVSVWPKDALTPSSSSSQ